MDADPRSIWTHPDALGVSWEWDVGLTIHSGRHAAEALRALYELMYLWRPERPT